LFIFLFFSNPSERNYLTRVSNDYTKFHHYDEIPVEVLQQIGDSNRTTYLLFSTYDYQFGKMKVFYFGFANSIYYIGLKRNSKKERPLKIV
jgi:hypothetical protein